MVIGNIIQVHKESLFVWSFNKNAPNFYEELE
jgi:hypothetical protein